MLNFSRLLLLLSIVGILPCLANSPDNVVFLTNKALDKIVGASQDDYNEWKVYKLPSSDGVYAIYFSYSKNPNAPLCALIPFDTMRVSKTLKCPGVCGYLNKRHEFVAWTSDFAHEMSFRNGKIVLNQHGNVPFSDDYDYCEFDTAGEYFGLQKSHNVGVFSVDDPDGKPLLTFPQRWLGRIFSTDDRIFLFLRNNVDANTECTVVSKASMRILRQFSLPEIDHIYDLSPDGKRLLAGTSKNWMYAHEPPYRNYIVDLATLKRTPVHQEGDYGFFNE